MLPVRAHLATPWACVCFLAQSPEAVGEATQRVMWSVLGILVGVALLIGIGLVVRRLVLGAADKEATRGFTLEQMRRMHERGELTEEEWVAARNALLAQGRQMAADVEGLPEASGRVAGGAEAPEDRPTTHDAPQEGADGEDGDNDGAQGDRPGDDADERPPPSDPAGPRGAA